MRTADLHLQRSTETLLGYLQGIACDDHLSASRSQPGMWHSRPGCDSAPHHALRNEWPFDELTDRLEGILSDTVLTPPTAIRFTKQINMGAI